MFLYIFFVRKPETHSSHSCLFLPRIVAFYAVSGTLAPPLKEPVQKKKKKSILMMIMTIKTVHSNNDGNSLPRGCSPSNSNSSSTTISV